MQLGQQLLSICRSFQMYDLATSQRIPVNKEGDLNLYRAWASVNTKAQFVEAGDP